jgi:hypothetical protein
MLEPLDRILPLPYPHFMGFAPLDAWWRLLTQDGAWRKIPARYWPRLAAGLFTSSIGTAVTLLERLLLAFLLPSPALLPTSPPAQATDRRLAPLGSDPLFILGYYRSGTTHLHYLLSCDPKLVTPRWYQMLAPQGFALSWTILRYFLVPFLSSRRPQDDVAYGPEYPAEDDFGVCNLSVACAMPGRMVLPGCWDYYSRFHSLDGLTDAELTRFRRAQLAVSWKLAYLNPGRGLLFKTPSHTARVAELCRLYPNARFIHLHRDAAPVVKSNVAMHRRYAPFLLQPHPGDEEIRRRVIAEYEATERRFLAESAALPPDRLIRIRYEDLIADPIGQVRAAYTQLNLELTPQFEQQMTAYLDSVRAYRTASEKPGGKTAPDPLPELEWMHEAFGHSRPAVPQAAAPVPRDVAARRMGESSYGQPETPEPLLTGPTAALVAAAFAFAAWIAIAATVKDRLDFLAWPTGVAIGLAALRSAGTSSKKGTTALGLWALFLTLMVILSAAYPATWLAVRDKFSPINLPHHVWLATRRGLLATNNFLWLGLGLASAYRFASREHVRPPGL